MFFQDFALWIWLEKKDRNWEQSWASPGPNWLWVELMLFTSHLWRRNRGKSFWSESSMVKRPSESHGARWNKSHYLFICFISSLVFLLLRTSTWRESEALVVPQVPDALGDNKSVYTSLSLEHIQPHDSPRFSLWGMLTCLLLLTHNWSMGWGHGGWPVGQVPSREGRLAMEG